MPRRWNQHQAVLTAIQTMLETREAWPEVRTKLPDIWGTFTTPNILRNPEGYTKPAVWRLQHELELRSKLDDNARETVMRKADEIIDSLLADSSLCISQQNIGMEFGTEERHMVGLLTFFSII